MLRAALVIVISLVALLPVTTGAGGPGEGSYVIVFEPTAMLDSQPPAPVTLSSIEYPWPLDWPANGTEPAIDGMKARTWMVIRPRNGKTDVSLHLRGTRPKTLYTIWTVFRPLTWFPGPSCPTAAELAAGCPQSFIWPITPSLSTPWQTKPNIDPFPDGALPWYPEGLAVAPTAPIKKAFTNGMGIDPGLAFYTNERGDANIHVRLDFNLLGTTYDDGPGVGIATTAAQCVLQGPPVPPNTYTAANCPPVQLTINGKSLTTIPRFTVASSWLRKFIWQVKDPAECANYDPNDPTSIFWQCIDPATVDPKTGTGLPRVWRYPFSHFRLASHPDELTHGFIGGSAWEHTIDLVGQRCKIQPPLPGEKSCLP